LCRLILGSCHCARDGDYVLANAHADCTHEQEVSAAHFLDEVEAWERGYDVYAAFLGQWPVRQSESLPDLLDDGRDDEWVFET
jgi:hypothetical protein